MIMANRVVELGGGACHKLSKECRIFFGLNLYEFPIYSLKRSDEKNKRMVVVTCHFHRSFNRDYTMLIVCLQTFTILLVAFIKRRTPSLSSSNSSSLPMQYKVTDHCP